MVDHNDYKESPFTNLCECSTLKIDDYVIIKTHPCRVKLLLFGFRFWQIVEITHSKPGKTGRPKTYVIGLDIFTNKKYEEVFLRCHNVERPIVTIKEYSLLDISYDGFVTLMEDGFIPKEDDLKIPDDCEVY